MREKRKNKTKYKTKLKNNRNGGTDKFRKNCAGKEMK